MIGRLLVAVVFVATSCGNDEAPRRAVETNEPTPTQATVAPTPCAVPGASLDERKTSTAVEASPVTDVRFDKKDTCPRIVFEFRDGLPGYGVAYAEPPFTECGSGEEIETDGWDARAFLEVKLEPSASVDLARNAEPTYEGPRDIAVDGEVLKHMRVSCDFEGQFQWVVGLAERAAFKVATLDDPARLVIDIART